MVRRSGNTDRQGKPEAEKVRRRAAVKKQLSYVLIGSLVGALSSTVLLLVSNWWFGVSLTGENLIDFLLPRMGAFILPFPIGGWAGGVASGKKLGAVLGGYFPSIALATLAWVGSNRVLERIPKLGRMKYMPLAIIFLISLALFGYMYLAWYFGVFWPGQ